MHVLLLLFVDCLVSQQHAGALQGRICSDKFTCCLSEIEVADQTFYLTQSLSVSVLAQDGIVAIGKAHMRSASSLSSLPKVALKQCQCLSG